MVSFIIHLCGGKTMEEYDEVTERLERAQAKIGKLEDQKEDLKVQQKTTKNLLSEEEAQRKSKEAALKSEEAARKAQEAAVKSLKARSTVTGQVRLLVRFIRSTHRFKA